MCEQTVTTLPAPLPADEVDAARARLAEADRAVTAAQSAAREADAAAVKAEADLAAGARRRTALAGDLADLLSGPLAAFPLTAARAVAAAQSAAADHAGTIARSDGPAACPRSPGNGNDAAGGRA